MRAGYFMLSDEGLTLSPRITIPNGAIITCKVFLSWDKLRKMQDPQTEVTRIVEGVIHRVTLSYTPED